MNRFDRVLVSNDKARIELEQIIHESSDEANLHLNLGYAYAGLGRKEDAIREANKAVELYPISKDAWVGPAFVRTQAIIYTMVGEYEAALDKIEYLLSIPSFGVVMGLSVPLLRIDPIWDPLRSHPRFQKILNEYNKTIK